MAKNIGVLAAVTFVLSAQGVMAASISETRLKELMASTSMQEVSLETLRARDRSILEELARSLASRYSDVLAGSEMVFTRLSESGSLFYRLDFVGLKNEDRARALCEILEMERCVARIGDDRLRVLEVRSDPLVSAIAVVEEDEKPFDWVNQDPPKEANPQADAVEARVRSLLDPLTTYPEPRPDFDTLGVDASKTPVIKEPVKQAPLEAGPKEAAETADASKIFPLPRPFQDVAELMPPPVPLARPQARIAALTTKVDHERKVALIPLARPFGAEVASVAKRDLTPEDHIDQAVRKVARAETNIMSSASSYPGLGGLMGGYVEVADAGIPPAAAAQPTKTQDAVIRLPGIGEVDMAKIQTSAPRIELARVVLPGIAAQDVNAPDSTPVLQAKTRDHDVTPEPLVREIALAELEAHQKAAAEAAALAAGAAAPHPVSRNIALIEIAPPPAAMTSVAALSAGLIETSPSVVSPFVSEAPRRVALPDGIDAPLAKTDLAMVVPEAPERPATMIAEVEPAEKAPTIKRRLTITAPKVASKNSQEDDRRKALTALALAQASGQVAHLGTVSFDDRYARPASIDFNEGHVAGRLQKLPFHRPDLSGYVQISTKSPKPLHEVGVDTAAMTANADGPYEIAQVPTMLSGFDEDIVSEEDAPFEINDESENSTGLMDKLDMLLSADEDQASDDAVVEDLGAGLLGSPDDVADDTDTDINAILGLTQTRERPGTQATPPAAPVASTNTRPGPPSADAEQGTQRPFQLTPDMRRPSVNLPAQPSAVAAKKNAETAGSDVAATASTSSPLTGTATAQKTTKVTEQDEDAIMRQRIALETLAQIVEEREKTKEVEVPDAVQPVATQEIAPVKQVATRNTNYAHPEGTMQRRAMPGGSITGNSDLAAAREIASYEASFSDDRTPTQKAANPLGQVSANEKMDRKTSLSNPTSSSVTPAELRIELSYVGSRQEVMSRVAELKAFFPQVMMSKGRFYGASVPGQTGRFVVGIAAEDIQSRDDIIWYLEQMGLPWAVRAQG